MALRRTRLLKEISQLKQQWNDLSATLIDDFDGNSAIETLSFEISGPEGTPLAQHSLQLEMKITGR